MVTSALKRPVTAVIIVVSLLIFSVLSAIKIPIDIFPQLNMPTIYVIESYGACRRNKWKGFSHPACRINFCM